MTEIPWDIIHLKIDKGIKEAAKEYAKRTNCTEEEAIEILLKLSDEG